MDRRQVLIAMLAVAAGCAAVAAVGLHARSTRRAAWLATIQPDESGVEPNERTGTAPAHATTGVDSSDNPARQTAGERQVAGAEAVLAAASEPPARANHKGKKKAKPRFNRDARRMSDAFSSPVPRVAPNPSAESSAVTPARRALALVGVDPDAEALWSAAINDPSRSAHERQDLIEDLNEDGFPDPKHVTADDLPLIESRLALIEQFAPDALDDVNAAAFAEAYKDLMNMYGRAVAESGEQ